MVVAKGGEGDSSPHASDILNETSPKNCVFEEKLNIYYFKNFQNFTNKASEIRGTIKIWDR